MELNRAIEGRESMDVIRALEGPAPGSFNPAVFRFAAQAYFNRALQGYRRGAPPDEIVSDLDQAACFSPWSPRIWYHLGLAHLKSGRPAQGLRALRFALELRVEPRSLYHAAWAAVASGHPDAAAWLARLEASGQQAPLLRSCCEGGQAAEAPEGTAASLIAEGNRALLEEDADRALRCFETARDAGLAYPALDRTVARLLLRRGMAQLRAGSRSGRQDLARAVDLEPALKEHVEGARSALASLEAVHGSLDAVPESAQTAWIREADTLPAALHNLALAGEMEGTWERAAGYWKRWMRAMSAPGGEPMSPVMAAEAWRRLARCYAECRRPDDQAAALEAILELDGSSAEACDQLAALRSQAGRFEEAACLLERLIGLDGENADRLDRLGWARIKAGDPDGGSACLRRALELDPDNPPAFEHMMALYTRRLNALDRREYGEGGAEVIREALTAFPRRAVPRLLLAEHHALVGNWKRARQAIGEALTLEPASAGIAAHALGLVIRHGSRREVSRFSGRILEQHSGDAHIQLDSGVAFLTRGRRDLARRHFEAALASSREASVPLAIAEAYVRTWTLDPALSHARLALEREPENQEAREMVSMVEESIRTTSRLASWIGRKRKPEKTP